MNLVKHHSYFNRNRMKRERTNRKMKSNKKTYLNKSKCSNMHKYANEIENK